MNTILVLLMLGCSQLYKQHDAFLWKGVSNVLYYGCALISVAIAVMKDLHVPLLLPAGWLSYVLDRWIGR
ncbi:MAG: hypothetical protein ACM32O_20990 [Clostridia bacterium]